eukprot:Gb_20187 [translate_table: standard]
MNFSVRVMHQCSKYTSNSTPHIQGNCIRKTKGNGGPDVSILCRTGRLKEALSIMHSMDWQGILIDSNTYASILQACANTKALLNGMQIHAHMIEHGSELNLYLGAKLVTMYVNCGSLRDARQVFDKMPKRNVFSWTAMIGEYARRGRCGEALALYYEMQRDGTLPDKFIFPCVLKACAGLAALQQGKNIHVCIARCGFESDIFVGNALIDMYSKCRSIESARLVFDRMSQRDVVSWNAMIAGYSHNGHCDEALKLFRLMQMEGVEPNVVSWTTMIAGYAQNKYGNEALKLFCGMQLAGVKPNLLTIASVLTACADSAALQQGKEIHGYTIRSGFELDEVVGSALVGMYTKCECLEDGRRVFDNISQKDMVSWTTMIAGYAQNGNGNQALKLFCEMQLAGAKPDLVTIASVLPACAHLAALQQGKEIHDYIIRRQFESDVVVGSALVDMYAKCGSIDHACQVFEKISQRDVISWNAMIAGYAMHGHGGDALALFHQMQHAGMMPDDTTFTGILSACSHAGLVEEGWQYFDLMSHDYCFTPTLKHYACMVDLLGRAGHLDEAYDFINNMPIKPNAQVWGALLGACVANCDIELGECVAEYLFNLEPQNVVNYVLLSNIYAAIGRWDDVAKVRKMMKDRGLKKSPGCSRIEVKNRLSKFLAGDKSHAQTEKIYAMLEKLDGQMAEAGYVPDMNFVLNEVEEKEHIISGTAKS